MVVFDNNRDEDDGGGGVRIASCVATACGGRRSRVKMLGGVDEAAAAIEGAISALLKVSPYRSTDSLISGIPTAANDSGREVANVSLSRRHRRRRLQCRCDRDSISRRCFAYFRAATSSCLLSKQSVAAAYCRIIVDICGDRRLRSGAIFARFSWHDFGFGVDLFLKRRLESVKRIKIVVEAAKSADSASAAAYQPTPMSPSSGKMSPRLLAAAAAVRSSPPCV